MGLIMMDKRSNDALNINPPSGASHLSVGGSDWLWAVTAIYILLFLVYFVLGIKPKHGEAIFHYIFTIALFTGSVAWFAMASDLGFSVVTTELYQSSAPTYQVFFAKYINWVVAFPSVLLALGLASGVSWATIIFNIFISWAWIVSYLISAVVTSSYKWGFYAFGTLAYFILAYQTLGGGRASAVRLTLGRDYSLLAGWLNLLWILYPIAFACTDGGNVIGVTQSLIWFGILDLLMIPGLAIAFLVLAPRWDYAALNLYFTQYGRVRTVGDGVFPEKQAAPAGTTAGVTTAPATATPAVDTV